MVAANFINKIIIHKDKVDIYLNLVPTMLVAYLDIDINNKKTTTLYDITHIESMEEYDKKEKTEINLSFLNSQTNNFIGENLIGSPNYYDPIKILESTNFARLYRGKYKSQSHNSQIVLTKQQKLWGIFTIHIEIEKSKLCELRFVKHCSLEKVEV